MSNNVLSGNVILTQSLVNSYVWPVSIAANTTVKLGENITLNGNTKYFTIDGSNIIIDGSYNTITITNVTNYAGVFSPSEDLTFLLGYSDMNKYIQNTTIKNLGVLSSNSTLANMGGWICQSNFGSLNQNVLISNCYSNGVINGINSGGIIGYNCAYGGYLTIENCYTTGIITGKYAGGIVGSGGCYSFFYNTITNQASTKDFSNFGGTGNDDEGP